MDPHEVQLGARLDLVQKPLQLLVADAKLGVFVAGRNVRMHLHRRWRGGDIGEAHSHSLQPLDGDLA